MEVISWSDYGISGVFIGTLIYFISLLRKDLKAQQDAHKEEREQDREIVKSNQEAMVELKGMIHVSNKTQIEQNTWLRELVEYERTKSTECYNKTYSKICNIEEMLEHNIAYCNLSDKPKNTNRRKANND